MHDWRHVQFEWDEGNEDHILRHGVHPEDVEDVIGGKPLIRRVRDRYFAYGRDGTGRYLTIVFVVREATIRVITARDMDKSERRLYDRHR